MRYFPLLILILLVSCGPLTKEDAFEQIKNKGVYNSYFYAPIHIGRQVVTLEDGASLKDYINDRYGILIQDGMIDVDVQKESSWRNVYFINLTEKGKQLCDAKRSDDEHAFVAVCKVVPVKIDSLIPLENTKSVECRYTIEQKEITPFGKFLQFEEGKTYPIIDTISK